MYGPLWRLLPGPWPVKALMSVVLAAAVVAACFLWVFPTIAPMLPFNANTVDSGPQSPGAPTPNPQSRNPQSPSPTASVP